MHSRDVPDGPGAAPDPPAWEALGQRVVENYRTTLARAEQRYGLHTRGTYLVTFVSVLALFDLYVQALGDDDQPDAASKLMVELESLRLELLQEFQFMVAPSRAGRVAEACLIEGAPGIALTFVEDLAEMRRGRRVIQNMAGDLDHSAAAEAVPGVYMYCIQEDRRIRIYRKPMSFQEMLVGIRCTDLVVKHPMLVGDDAAVLAAGEIYLSRSHRTGMPAGAFLTGTSGHYQPPPSSEAVACGLAKATLRLPGEAIWSLTGGRYPL